MSEQQRSKVHLTVSNITIYLRTIENGRDGRSRLGRWVSCWKNQFENPDEFAAPWEDANQSPCDDTVLGLFTELKHIAAATVQVVHAGSTSHVREAQKILNQARKALYRLLADDVAENGDE